MVNFSFWCLKLINCSNNETIPHLSVQPVMFLSRPLWLRTHQCNVCRAHNEFIDFWPELGLSCLPHWSACHVLIDEHTAWDKAAKAPSQPTDTAQIWRRGASYYVWIDPILIDLFLLKILPKSQIYFLYPMPLPYCIQYSILVHYIITRLNCTSIWKTRSDMLITTFHFTYMICNVYVNQPDPKHRFIH